WATCNIGAEKPWNSGYYFYWGDKDGSSRNFSFSASNTPTMGKDISALQRDGWITLDNVLSPEHDAARVQWGGRWRMPTYEEFKDLNNNCDWDWTIVNGVKGYIVRGRGDYASVSIFFPCAGSIFNSSIELSGSECWYWSSTARWSDAYKYTFSRSFKITKYEHVTGSAYRYYGFLIRPVQGFTK
ncbi:MAG: hypothetical protein IIW14_08010, partial [Kiritimatiellae bacterium]|nr:hypothetical protein [Kiritimatiellia bacterium]